jgi:hypothetical protein
VFVNSEFSGSSGDGLVLGCGSTSHVVDNCTFTANGGAAIVGRPLAGMGAGGPWQVEIERSILWRNGERGLTSALGCELAGELVSDSVVEGGYHSGSNIVDADPLFVRGQAMDYYLSSMTAGQPADSPAADGGPALSADLGLDALTTRVDSGLDLGRADWGVHCAPSDGGDPSLVVRRGQAPNDLAFHAAVDSLPFTDDADVLQDALLPLLFYSIEWPMNDIHVSKNEALQTVDIAF